MPAIKTNLVTVWNATHRIQCLFTTNVYLQENILVSLLILFKFLYLKNRLQTNNQLSVADENKP